MPKHLLSVSKSSLGPYYCSRIKPTQQVKKGFIRIRLISALRVLSDGLIFERKDELCELGETTSRNTFIAFIKRIVSEFGTEYLCCPTEADLRRILAVKSERGFLGCIESWDWKQWKWNNCPVAWDGL